MGFARQFTGGFEDVAGVRRFVTDTLLRDTEVYEAARLLVDEAITWASSPVPDRPGHVVWFELEA